MIDTPEMTTVHTDFDLRHAGTYQTLFQPLELHNALRLPHRSSGHT